MVIAENIKKRIDDYWLRGFYQYKPDNTILLKCDTSTIWLNNDQFYKDIVLGVDVLASRIAFELSGTEENVQVVRAILLNRICTNLTYFLESINGKSPHFLVEYEHKPINNDKPLLSIVEVNDQISVEPTEESKVSIPQVTTKKKKEIK